MDSKDEAAVDVGLLETARNLLSDISRISPLWVGLVTLLAFLSAFEVTRTVHGDVEVQFHVTAITAAIVALAWLPALVRAVAMTGGAVKTPAGEASARGILDLLRPLPADAKRKVLPSLAAALDSAEATAGSREKQVEVRSARRRVERELGPSVNPLGKQTDEVLDVFARHYEVIRSESGSGPERTFRMGSLMAEVRAFAESTVITPPIVKERYAQGRDGDRVVALTLLEASPMPQCLDQIIDGVRNSHSAFEQFQALRAAEESLPRLGPADRTRLAKALREQLDDDVKGIHQDASRLHPIELMLDEIEGSGRG